MPMSVSYTNLAAYSPTSNTCVHAHTDLRCTNRTQLTSWCLQRALLAQFIRVVASRISRFSLSLALTCHQREASASLARWRSSPEREVRSGVSLSSARQPSSSSLSRRLLQTVARNRQEAAGYASGCRVGLAGWLGCSSREVVRLVVQPRTKKLDGVPQFTARIIQTGSRFTHFSRGVCFSQFSLVVRVAVCRAGCMFAASVA